MNADPIFLLLNGTRSGPHTADDVRTLVASGEIKKQDLAWRDGMAEWRPLEEVISFDGLPPLPRRDVDPKPAHGTAVRQTPRHNHLPLSTISGAIGLLLVILSVFAVGSCSKSANDLQKFVQTLNSPDGQTEMLLRSFNRGMNGDPLGQYFDTAEAQRNLEAQAEDARLWAILCIVATGICGVVFLLTSRTKREDTKSKAIVP